MSCFSWLRKGSTGTVQYESTLSENRPNSNTTAVDVSVGSLEIPGGLAGIKQRMASLGHFLNDHGEQEGRVRLQSASSPESKAAFSVEDAASRNPRRSSMPATATSGKGDHVLLSATFCDDRGKPVSVSPQPARSASNTEGSNHRLCRSFVSLRRNIETN